MYRAAQQRMPDPSRLTKVRKSMNRIKQVGVRYSCAGAGQGGRLPAERARCVVL